MSRNEQKSGNANVAPKHLAETAVFVVLMLSAMFIKDLHPISVSLMIIALAFIGAFRVMLWWRLQSSEKREQYDAAANESQNKPTRRVIRFAPQFLMLLVILILAYALFS